MAFKRAPLDRPGTYSLRMPECGGGHMFGGRTMQTDKAVQHRQWISLWIKLNGEIVE
jgi:hypothetical protein